MNPIIAFIKLIRLPNLLIIALTQYAIRYGIFYPIIYNFSGGQDIPGVGLQMSNLNFFLLSLSTVMIAAAGYIINDYFDVKIDRVNRSESIIVGAANSTIGAGVGSKSSEHDIKFIIKIIAVKIVINLVIVFITVFQAS